MTRGCGPLLAAGHALAARRDELRMTDSAAEGLVVNTVTGTVRPGLWPGRARPRVATTVGAIEDWLIAIAAGQGFAVAAASTAQPRGSVR